MRYALIEDNIVVNIIELSKKNESLFPSAVQIETDRPININDEYRDGKFYHDGEVVLTNIEGLSIENEELTNDLGVAIDALYSSDMEVINNV